MDKNQLLNILQDWNFWQHDLESGFPRSAYLEKMKKLLPYGLLAVTGVRRSGKSYLLRQLAKSLSVPKEEILLINLEDPRLAPLSFNSLQIVFETYCQGLRPKGKPYLFLDEIQEVPAWEKWVRMMSELGKANLIISGSNSRLLGTELATLLTGRHLDLTVFPLSFKEFLSFGKIQPAANLEIKSSLMEYLEFGGFPQVVLNSSKKEILVTYLQDILEKDISKRYQIRKTEKLKNLANFYLSNFSSKTTFSSLEKQLLISADTIEKFSAYFENNYLFFFLKRFSYKTKEQDKSPRKVYAIDTGLANLAGFRFSENWGKLAENLVFLELLRRQKEIYYWKDEQHREVDFLIKEGLKVTEAIQVCWQMDNQKTKKREFQNLVRAMKELKINSGLIITDSEEREERIDHLRIKIVPLWRWLLDKS